MEFEEWRCTEAQTLYFASLSGMDLGQYDPATPLVGLIDGMPGIRRAFLSLINAWPEEGTPTTPTSALGIRRSDIEACSAEGPHRGGCENVRQPI